MVPNPTRARRAAAAALFIFTLLLAAAVAQAREPVVAKEFMVAAAHPLAVEAGVEVLGRGGSALDAAVAVQMVLGLVEPQSSGIGGGAFLLYWSQKERKLRSYDGRESAPAAAQADRFLRDGKPMPFMEAVVGGRSVGVPGVLRMLELAHRRHGRLPWAELFSPAIRIAESGFDAPPRLREALAQEGFLRHALFFDPDGKPRSRIVNPEYATTLRSIARGGADVFYGGPIAEDIVRAVRSHANPGDLAEDDLAGYRALEREPVCGPYRGRRVCSMGPPSSGGVAVLQILGILERTAFARAPPHSAQAVHLFTEAGRLAFADRARYLGDPDFVSIPLRKLLGKDYLDKRAGLIGERSMDEAQAGDTEANGTSHVSIVDRNGDAVAMTTTVESPFGSRIVVRGFILNNQLTDFDFVPGSANAVGAGRRPRSSMAPTMVFEKATPILILGSPGGAMIINYVAKALVARLDWGLDLQAAIAAPNLGTRNGPTLLEKETPYAALEQALAERGHGVVLMPLVSGLHGIERVPGGWRGAADPRRDGAAMGR